MGKQKLYPFFVYGTLMSGQPNNRTIESVVDRVEEGTIYGALFNTGSYPVAFQTNGQQYTVKGQWLYIDAQYYNQALSIMDRIEGYNGVGNANNLYNRTLVEDIHTGVKGWMYVGGRYFQNMVSQLPWIESGDWLDVAPKRKSQRRVGNNKVKQGRRVIEEAIQNKRRATE